MIYINTSNKLLFSKPIKYVLTDFDRTITTINSDTTWGLFTKSPRLDKAYSKEGAILYKYYRNIELDNNISKIDKMKYMEEWALKEVMLFSKYGINYETYLNIINENNGIIIRPDFKDFVNSLSSLNIPIYIVSGGLLEPITNALDKYKIIKNNITIITNTLEISNGEITGLNGQVIHSSNKDQLDIPVNSYETGLLFGDLPGDLLMSKGRNTINIGFLNDADLSYYNKIFDITLTDNSSFNSIKKLLIK